MFVEIEPCTMLGELGMPASSAACERVVASLRRIAMTDVSVHNWGDNAIAEQGPLLTIEARANKSWFIVSVPDWLQDEVNAGRIVKALPEALTLSGQRARLYGWARGWLGRKVGDVRFITKREALARADSDADAWDALMEATAADDVPGYQISSDVFEGQPAIAIAHRAAPAPAQTFHSIEIDLDPDMTEDWFSRLSTSPNPPLVEIEI
jgi:hypothetical protein